MIERDGKALALRAEDGRLALPPATRASYSVDNWLLADGDGRDAKAASAASPLVCDLLGCIGRIKGKTIAFVRHPAALEDDCRLADVVIAPFSVGRACERARVVVDRRALQSEGAHTLYFDGLSIRTESVAMARGNRPWVRERPLERPALPAGQVHARDRGITDDGDEGRSDVHPGN